MIKFNKYVFIVCITVLGSACKDTGGGSTSAESLSGEGQQKYRSSVSSSTRYRSSHRSTSHPTPTANHAPSTAPHTPTAIPQPAPTPVVVTPDPRPAAPSTPVAAVPTPAPTPAPVEAPTPAPTVVGNAQLSWTAPTKRENGDSLQRSELSHYEVYYTSESGKSDTIKVSDTSRTALTVNDLEGDTYYFAMAAVDKDGIFSELSNEVPKTIK